MNKSEFRVSSQRLKNLRYEINTTYNFPEQPVKLEMDFHTEINKHAQKPMAEVSLTLTLFAKTKEAPFKGSITYQGLFNWKEGTPANRVDIYLQCNALALLYSYMRPMLTTITAMSNMPPLTIPFMNFHCGEEEKKKED